MQNNKLFSFCNVYIFLWIVYGLQSILFGSYGTMYSRLILAFLLMVSVYYTIFAFTNYKIPSYMKGLGVMILMFTLYGSVYMVKSSNYVYLQTIYNSLLPVFPFYVFTRKGQLNKSNLVWWIAISFVVVTLQFFQHQRENMQLLIEKGSKREEFTNNYGYNMLSVLPLLAFLSKKRILQYFGLGYVMVFVLLAMKRGAILITAICILWFFLVSMKNVKGSRRTVVVLLSVVVLFVGYYYFQSLLQNSDLFNSRIQNTIEGDSSGRDKLFAGFLRHYLEEPNPLRFLFGNGANATMRIMHEYAHNDWLELAINQGLLGIVLYVFYWVGFYKTCRRSKFDDDIFLAVSLLLISNFIRSFFSMSYGDMSRFTTLCIGYCMGMISEHENQLHNSQIIVQT